MCKKRVGVIFGGRSEEHEISLKSATFVIEALDSDKFQLVYIGITKEGKWKTFRGPSKAIEDGTWEQYTEDFNVGTLKDRVDFVIPVLHGPYGEDGTIQGLLEMMDIPYGGCGVLASAAAMDKHIFKEILKARNLPICQYLAFDKKRIKEDFAAVSEEIAEHIGFPCFVKPANMGSSVGITKVREASELRGALRTACTYDRRVVVEEFVPCRELEVAVFGNDTVHISEVGEILPSKEFYDYKAKYVSEEDPSRLTIPAELPEEEKTRIRELAIEVFKAIDGRGFGRVDFFKDKNTGKIYINEVNTIPGFTGRSMFPLLWQHAGMEPEEIVERIIDLGYERHYAKNCGETAV